MAKGLTAKKDEDFSEWYTQVIQKAELMDYSAVSGCMVMRPDSQEVWDSIRDYFDKEIKKRGVRNASFPLLIPEFLLQKESEHVEGFNPEVAWVTETGDSKLSERLAIRPTSETIIYDSFKDWIMSHNDLPLKINQWANVIRWEFKHPMPFIRTREFFWQEGHTAYSNAEDAAEEVEDIIRLYKQVFEELLAVPVLIGEKSEKERFAGAEYTLSVESFMPNGKAIQAGTSHFMGQNFSEPFDIKFQDEDGENKYAYTNSWGFSTRSLGMMVMMHGDDDGLVMPPRVAPLQAVIVPITFSDKPDVNKKVLSACEEALESLNARAKIDDRDNYTPGWKYNHWELKGVPVRVEIGPRDLEDDSAMVVRRDTGDKESVKLNKLSKHLDELLEEIHMDLLEKARKFMEDSTVKVDDYKGLKKAIDDDNMALAKWCCRTECEEFIKDDTGGAKTLNMPLDQEEVDGSCVRCDENAEKWCYFAKSY